MPQDLHFIFDYCPHRLAKAEAAAQLRQQWSQPRGPIDAQPDAYWWEPPPQDNDRLAPRAKAPGPSGPSWSCVRDAAWQAQHRWTGTPIALCGRDAAELDRQLARWWRCEPAQRQARRARAWTQLARLEQHQQLAGIGKALGAAMCLGALGIDASPVPWMGSACFWGVQAGIEAGARRKIAQLELLARADRCLKSIAPQDLLVCGGPAHDARPTPTPSRSAVLGGSRGPGSRHHRQGSRHDL